MAEENEGAEETSAAVMARRKVCEFASCEVPGPVWSALHIVPETGLLLRNLISVTRFGNHIMCYIYIPIMVTSFQFINSNPSERGIIG